MRSFAVFAEKELKEHFRTWRAAVLGAVFLLFGMMSPATAKFTPEILKMAGGDTGIEIALPPVTVLDSYVQFFKNMNSMGVIVLLLVFAGLVSDEKAKGSASLMLTKGLSRPAFVLSKYAAAALVWTATYALSALACLGYTAWFFPGEVSGALFPGFAAYWLYGLMLLAFTALASTLARGHGMAALGAFSLWGLAMLSMIPKSVAEASPAALGAVNVQIISGALPAADLLVPAVLAAALIALSLAGAARSLAAQEL